MEALPVPAALLQVCPSAESTGNQMTVRDGRRISFATSGEPGGTSVLWFVNLAISRWVALLLHSVAKETNVQLIVVDRPGVGQTDPAPKGVDRFQVVTDDVSAVLEGLRLQKVKVLASCAGTVYAFHFLAAHGNRMVDGPVAITPPWVHPTDCGATMRFFRFASHLPSWLVRSALWLGQGGFGMVSHQTLQRRIANSMFPRRERTLLTDAELASIASALPPILAEGLSQSKGGAIGDDAVLCLAAIPSDMLPKHKECKIIVGDRDELIPVGAAEWLAEQLPQASLEVVAGASHMGVELFPCRMKKTLDYLLSGDADI